MNRKTRLFLLGAVAALVLALGAGLVAYLTYRQGALPAGLAPEIRFVPADAQLVAFVDVRAVMASELHRTLVPALESQSPGGREMLREAAGLDIEREVNRLLVLVAPPPGAEVPPSAGLEHPHPLVLVQGEFPQDRLEAHLRDRGAVSTEVGGRRRWLRAERGDEFAVGVLQPGLLAIGRTSLVDRTLERAATGGAEPDLTANAEMMALVGEVATGTAWVVARYDALQGVPLPGAAGKVPPLEYLSARADIDSAVRAVLRADADTAEAAGELRDLLRGFIALARMQGGQRPEFAAVLESIELDGTDKTVRLSLVLPPELFASLVPAPAP